MAAAIDRLFLAVKAFAHSWQMQSLSEKYGEALLAPHRVTAFLAAAVHRRLQFFAGDRVGDFVRNHQKHQQNQ